MLVGALPRGRLRACPLSLPQCGWYTSRARATAGRHGGLPIGANLRLSTGQERLQKVPAVGARHASPSWWSPDVGVRYPDQDEACLAPTAVLALEFAPMGACPYV